MKVWNDIERLLAAIPKLRIDKFPQGTSLPRARAVKPLIEYNGFSGYARMRTWEVAKWLMADDKMPAPGVCNLCDRAADQYHAEDYYDFATYIPICRSCHGKVHSRLRNFNAFERRRDEWGKPAGHWIYLIGPVELPIAQWCEARNRLEPSYADFVANH